MSVPDRVLTNSDLEKMVDTSDDWITTRTGIKERRIGEEGEPLSKYAVEAGRRAIEASGVDPSEIDLIILATVTPDMPIPATACTIQHQLGCSSAASFDMQAGCTGFIYAQSVAKQFLLSGSARNVLVVGGEMLSKYVDWNDRATCVLFADGAGAAVMTTGEEPRGVLASALHTDGSMLDFLCMPGGGSLHPPRQEMIDNRLHFIRMRGNETFKVAVRSMSEVCREVLQKAGLKPSDVDWLVPHQANTRIINATARKLNMSMDKVVVTVDQHGNTSAASVPLALDTAVRDGRIQRGEVLLLEAFGGGFTWGSVLLKY